MTDIDALEARISDSGLKIGYIIEKLGLSRQGFNNKITGKTEFTISEVAILCDILDITSLKEKERIFFGAK